MNRWIKYRFWIAAGIFILSVVVALWMLLAYCKIADEELRYPLSLAIIGLGFTLGQFYFQVNENRYQKNHSRQQEENTRLKNLQLLTYKEIVNRLDAYIESLNRNLADIDSISLKDFVWHFNITSNSLDQFLHMYLPQVFNGINIKNEFIDFTNRLNSLSNVVSKMEGENVSSRKKMLVEIPALKDEIKEFIKLFKELVKEREKFLVVLISSYMLVSELK